jgi:hypothetical protein
MKIQQTSHLAYLMLLLTASAGALVQISTLAQLDSIRSILSGSYVLGAKIDASGMASGAGWVPVTSPTTDSL